LLSSAKKKPSQETVKSVNELCNTVLLHREHQKPALEVFVWHLREIPIPSLSPPGVHRHPTREEEICLACLHQVVTWTVKDDADHSAAELSRITLDRVWLWARYFFEVLLSDILDKPWTIALCCNTIFTSIAMLERDYLVTAQGAEVLIAAWLALGKDAGFRTRCHRIMSGTPLANGIHLALCMQDLIVKVFGERDQALLPAIERRNEEIRDAFTWAGDQIVEIAFLSLDAIQLDEAFRQHSLGVWRDLVANIALITMLQQDYSFYPRTELFTPAKRRSVMRILVWLTGKSPVDWKGENSKALINISRTLQQCLMYVDSVLDSSEDPYEGLVALIRNGLPAALARASPWLRAKWDFMASVSIRKKLDELQLDIVWNMWLLPVYEALDVQLLKQPSDMDPRIVARLRRWAPSRALLGRYANNEVMPPLWGQPGSPSSCSFSKVRGFIRCVNSWFSCVQCPRRLEQQSAPHRKCNGCGGAFYCNRVCQAGAWKASGDNHRLRCLPMMARARCESYAWVHVRIARLPYIARPRTTDGTGRA
jgi:hypothetical protein